MSSCPNLADGGSSKMAVEQVLTYAISVFGIRGSFKASFQSDPKLSLFHQTSHAGPGYGHLFSLQNFMTAGLP